jgi:tetratricopeptide (TPR) repeat protein
LHPLDETVLLALSLSITNTSPAHGLTTEQIHAFVTRVLEDGSQNWSIHSMGLLLRSRLEANRSRTVERGLLQIQSLVDQLKLESVAKARGPDDLDLEKGATPLERLQYFWTMNLPSTWELEKELATRFLGLGVVRSAMEIFTRLEMWEDVAKCYSSLGEDQKAIKVVKDLLEGKLLESETTMAYSKSATKARELSPAQKAKLYCLLGDLERMPEHYETAWEISSQSSSRAMRSLGQAFFQVGDFSKAQSCLEKALAINPLFGKVWFVLGCAAMRNEDWPVAEKAFRRCTALDEEDGESWNNLATVVLRQTGSIAGKTSPPVSAEGEPSGDAEAENYDRKRTAFTCLGQAIKHSYDSWRVWVNYLLVSVDVGELMEACRAMARLCELRGEKDGEAAVDLDILDRLVAVVCKDAANAQAGSKPVNGHASLSDGFASMSTGPDGQSTKDEH